MGRGKLRQTGQWVHVGSSDLHGDRPGLSPVSFVTLQHDPVGRPLPGRWENGGYRGHVPQKGTRPGERVNPIIGRLTDGDGTDSPA